MFFDIPGKIIGVGMLVMVSGLLAAISYVGLTLVHVLPFIPPPGWLILWTLCGGAVALFGVCTAMLKDLFND